MTTTGVEVIDLTDPNPQSPALSESLVPVRSLREEKPPPSSARSPIVISDDDDAPVSSDPTRRRKARRRKKRKAPAEIGELVVTHDANNDDGSEMQEATQNGGNRHSSNDALFYLDDKPDASLDSNLNPDGSPDIVPAPAQENSLLLPDHVVLATRQVNGVLNAVEASRLAESDSEDFIHYADEELNVFTRYYEEPKDENERKAHLVCGQCGAEGDHKQADCPVLVCLTCGAHNEHSTRQCPIVKTCFLCGLKGHIKGDCPNRNAPRSFDDRGYDCARCYSDLHKTRECPALWRLYEYLDDSEREAILKSRREKENLPFNQGGEGYIGEDYWCYNCGGEGHLGDDCQIEPRHPDLREPSAFGSYNTMSGPFADHKFTSSNGRKVRREWEINGNFDDGHGFAGPSDVGRRGRDKERERMRRREKEMQKVDEEEEDWFGKLQNSGRSRSSGSKSKGKLTINMKNGDKSDKDKPRPSDSLLERISFGNPERGERGNRRQERGRERSASPMGKRDVDYYRSDDRSERGHRRDSESGRDRRRERDRVRDYRTPGDGPGRSGRSDKKRDEGRPGRQYYGSYTR